MRAVIARTTALREWRIEHGLTLAEMAALVGKDPSALSRIERLERRVRPLDKVRIARRLGVPVADLFPVEPIADLDEGEPCPSR